MADFNLYWNPGNPYETGNTQQVQYKLRTASSYTILATIAGFKDSYKATGLQDDRIYNFRIVNTCNNESSSIINTISFTCPAIGLFRSTDAIDYTLTPAGGDVDKYFIKLYEDGLFKTQEIYNSPFISTITGTFTGLDALKEYVVTVTARADELIGECDPNTNIPLVCVSITDINATSAP